MFDLARAALLVVTHNRPELLRHTLGCWRGTGGRFRRTVIVQNHGKGLDDVEIAGDTIIVQSGQHLGNPGNMSRSWNLGWQWAFNDLDVQWIMCSQDDVDVKGDWLGKVASRDADFYNAPGGDVVMLLSRRAARAVGWFDERFVVTGYHEWDWIARAVRALGTDRMVCEDRHGWAFNVVGLSECWDHHGEVDRQSRSAYYRLNDQWILRKWGTTAGGLAGLIASGFVPEPLEPEIDWYPWYTM